MSFNSDELPIALEQDLAKTAPDDSIAEQLESAPSAVTGCEIAAGNERPEQGVAASSSSLFDAINNMDTTALGSLAIHKL